MKFASFLVAFLIWLVPDSGYAADILWSNTGGSAAYWNVDGSKMNASGYLSPSTTSINWQITATGDFNADGKPDLLWRDTNGYLYVWYMDGKTMIGGSYLSPARIPTNWRVVGTSDFNADGKPDLLWQNDKGYVAVWYMNGISLTSSVYLSTTTTTSWKIAGVGDFNADGKPDLLWRDTNGYLYVWYMDGKTMIGGSYLSPSRVALNWRVAGVGDFNADGKPDLLWREKTGYVSVWFMNGVNLSSGSPIDPSWVSTDWRIVGVTEMYPLPKVTLNDSTQTVRLQVIDGQVKGLVSPVAWSDLESVAFNSDRVGWETNSIATVSTGSSYEVTLPNTSDNDVGGWAVKLKSTGKYVWFNVDRWKFAGKNWSKNSDGLIQYGLYAAPEVDFLTSGKLTLRFNSNCLSGFMSALTPSEVSRVIWNSDEVGWNSSSTSYASLKTDAAGHYYATLTIPMNGDHGSISIRKTNGSFVWMNIGGGWEFSDNVILDQGAGKIYYSAP